MEIMDLGNPHDLCMGNLGKESSRHGAEVARLYKGFQIV